MPIYPRETKRKGLVYDVVVAEGRKRVWFRGITTLDEAKKLLRKHESARDRGERVAQSVITVQAYLEDWIEKYAKKLPGKQTGKTYETNLKVHVIPRLGKKRLRDLTPKDVQDCIDAIQEHRSAKTALNVFRVLNEAIARAVRLEVINRNVCSKVDAPQPEKYVVQARTREELEQILDVADRTQYGAVAHVSLWVALRQGELLDLEWTHVDLDRARLYLYDAKHGSTGTMILPPECVDLLRAHGVSEEMKFKAFGPNFERPPWVFTNQVGAQMDASGLRRGWRSIEKKSGVKMRFHDLRHAHATLLINEGVHARVIQEQMRHKQWSTTMDTYGHLMPGLREAAARSISDAMRHPEKDQG